MKLLKPVYRSKWWPMNHKILVWTPSLFEELGNRRGYSDVRENMERVKKTRWGHIYDPSASYKRKLAKAARKGILPTYIQREEVI